MNRKKIVPYIAYLCAFFLLFLTEKKMGIAAFAVPFLMALVFCRRNIPVICGMFAAASMTINPNILNLVYAFTPCVVVLAGAFIHYKLKKKTALLTLNIYTVLSLAPYIFFCGSDIYQIVNTVISIVGAEILTYVMVACLYPVIVRGAAGRLKHSETVSVFICLCVAFLGLSFLEPFGINLFMLFAAAAIVSTLAVSPNHTLLVAAAGGLGGSIAQFTPHILALCVGMALVALALKETKPVFSAVGALAGYCAFSILFSMEIGLHIAVAAAGCAAAVAIPKSRLKMFVPATGENFAARTVLNRDRQEIATRLDGLSRVFYEMQDILRLDLNDKKKQYNRAAVTGEVCNKCCSACPYKKFCTEQFGSNTYIAEHLVACAMDNGRVTLLDLPSTLSNGCKRISALMAASNEVVLKLKRRQEVNASIEQGREMIVEQMGGVGMLLEKLGNDMKSRLSYDTVLEQKLIKELAQSDITVSEAIVYGVDKRIDRVIISLKDGEYDLKLLAGTVSYVMNRPMTEGKKEKSANGKISVHFIPAPKFGVLYGEKAVSGDGAFCGDNREAVRLDENRLMLILSDGMGTGEKAYRSSMNAILMIESFYRAGFDHETVLACVGRLLCLREQEDFNALDIAILDIKNGTVDFIKQGGRESFVLSKGIVEVIDCGSLPLGIVAESMPLIEQRKTEDGDVLVLCSDGVIDILTVDGIKEILLGSSMLNPQSLADAIIDNAVKLAGEKSHKDDMTCLAARIISANR